ncbi:MAG: hypothetical protein NW217_09440 [Hyphomicrobiaceae bacterium]|nr:hypothetical protein [Hyphomicrobiaceae bacterium]
MSMKTIGTLKWAVAILLTAVMPAPGLANETFVCEDGSIVTVLPGQLEAMKRTDPCVAAHYGIRRGGEDQRGAAPPPAPAPVASFAPADAPLPERKPNDEIADKLRALESPDALARSTRDVPLSVAAGGQSPGASAAPSDFRNVYILNAPAGAERYFRHTR